jgi:hypothetical protein
VIAANKSHESGYQTSHLGRAGLQSFLDTMYQNGGEMNQIITKLPNDHKIYQMAIKYSIWS